MKLQAPAVGPCQPWATVGDLCAPCDTLDLDPAVAASVLAAASEALFAWSGRIFAGVCETTLRPCRRTPAQDPPITQTVAWQPHRACPCARPRDCGCRRLPEVNLGVYPIREIIEVGVDGEILPAAAYRVDDWRWLVRTDGEGWPCCQDLAADVGEPGAFWVTVAYGRNPPELGRRAAADLACQLYLLCRPAEGECVLPFNVQSIRRRGLDVVIVPPGTDVRDQIAEAIPTVGAFLSAANPRRIQRPASVWSPDIGERVRRTGTGDVIS